MQPKNQQSKAGDVITTKKKVKASQNKEKEVYNSEISSTKVS